MATIDAPNGRQRCVQRGRMRVGWLDSRHREGAPRRESKSGVEQAAGLAGSCIIRSWVPGSPLTGLGRGRPNPGSSPGRALPLPLERVKSGPALEHEGRFARLSTGRGRKCGPDFEVKAGLCKRLSGAGSRQCGSRPPDP